MFNNEECRVEIDGEVRVVATTAVEDIASLLLLLHETYVKDSHGWREILLSLVHFLHDAKLSHRISLLNAEHFRRKVMNPTSDPDMMEYGEFYEWLREVAVFLCPFSGETGRKRSLHALLTLYIVPLANCDWEQTEQPVTLMGVPKDKTTLNVMLEYMEFYHLWFNSFLPIPTDSIEMKVTSPARIVLNLESIGLIPTVLNRAVVNETLRFSQSPQSLISFPSFLVFIEDLSKHIPINDLQILGSKDESEARSLVLLISVAECLLSSLTSSLSTSDAISRSQQLMRLCREGNVFRLAANSASLATLNSSKIFNCDILLDVPSCFEQLISDICPFKSQTTMVSIGVSAYGRCSLSFALACPSLLFAKNNHFPESLADLYRPGHIAEWCSKFGEMLDCLYLRFRTECDTLVPTFRGLILILNKMGVSVNLGDNTIHEILEDVKQSCSVADSMIISHSDLLEVCFLLSKAMFGRDCNDDDVASLMQALCLGGLHASNFGAHATRFTNPSNPVLALDSSLSLDASGKALAAAVERASSDNTQPASFLSLPAHVIEALVLLVHFPISNPALSPWNVAMLFQSCPSSVHCTHEILPLAFKSFSSKFGVDSEALTSHFGTYYYRPNKNEEHRIEMKTSTRKALSSPYLVDLLHNQSLSFLQLNEELLRLEFVRLAAWHQAENPFTSDISFRWGSAPPISISTGPFEEALPWCAVSEKAAEDWAVNIASLSPSLARIMVEDWAALCPNTDSPLQMTFGAFTVFAALCFCAGGTGAADKRHPSASLSALVDVIDVRATSLAAILELPRDYLLSWVMSHADRTGVDLTAEAEAVSKCALRLFNRLLECERLAAVSALAEDICLLRHLPPRPPAMLWDAARWLHFWRFTAQSFDSASLSAACLAFSALKNNPSHNELFANPAPIVVDPATITALLSSSFCGVKVGQAVLYGQILPLLASWADRHSKDSESLQTRAIAFEDLLRLGGSRAFGAWLSARDWLLSAFDVLARDHVCHDDPSATALEATLSAICVFFGCRGLLRAGALVVQAKRSLHSRKPSRSTEHQLTLSRDEFFEMFLRCSAAIWASLEVDSASGASEIEVFYRVRRDVTNRIHADSLGSTNQWGIDFVSPFLACLHRASDLGPLEAANSLDEPKYLPCLFTPSSLQAKLDTRLAKVSELKSHSHRTANADEMGNSSFAPAHKSKETANASNDPFTAPEGSRLSSAPDISRHAVIPSELVQTSGSDALLDGTKEALWPVYATYCSCGDALDPGKLSGPNLFALLSKLNVLTDRTLLSDIGILLHQISAHTNSQKNSAAIAAASAPEDPFDSPSLSFEEFLVFLCAFSQLRFDGVVSAPIFSSKYEGNNSSLDHSQPLMPLPEVGAEGWFENWRRFMGASGAFRRLVEEGVLPVLSRHALLAFPEDARHRDRYASVFSLEVLLAVEGSEAALRSAFEAEQAKNVLSGDKENGPFEAASASIVSCLNRINLVPQVLLEAEVKQLVQDVMPEASAVGTSSPGGRSKRSSSRVVTEADKDPRREGMLFPQWEWVLCVVAYQTVEVAVKQSSLPTNAKKIPKMVAEVITSMGTALASRL